MLTILMASMLASGDPVLREAERDGKMQTRYCRAAVSSKQRNGYLVCRTRAEWARWEECNRATRYCAPRKGMSGVTIGKTITAFPLNDDSKVQCRPMKTTGTRLMIQQICLPKREWARLHADTQEGVLKMQDRSTRPQGVQ